MCIIGPKYLITCYLIFFNWLVVQHQNLKSFILEFWIMMQYQLCGLDKTKNSNRFSFYSLLCYSYVIWRKIHHSRQILHLFHNNREFLKIPVSSSSSFFSSFFQIKKNSLHHCECNVWTVLRNLWTPWLKLNCGLKDQI